MNWLKAIFSRPATLTPKTASTAFGQTIQRMAAAADPTERARLGELLSVQLEGFLSSQAGNTYAVLLELEERIRSGQGETNDMISGAVALIREQGAAVQLLRVDFQDDREGLSEWRLGIESWQSEVDADRLSFKQSRQRSEAERQELFRRDDEAKAERAQLAAQGQEIAAQVERLATEFTAMLSLLSDFGFIEAFPDAIVVVGLDGTIIRVNTQAEELFGYHRADLIGKPIEELVPEELRTLHAAHRMEYTLDPHPRRMGHERPGTGRSRSFPAQRSDGQIVQIEVGLGPIILGGKSCIIATVRAAEAGNVAAG